MACTHFIGPTGGTGGEYVACSCRAALCHGVCNRRSNPTNSNLPRRLQERKSDDESGLLSVVTTR